MIMEKCLKCKLPITNNYRLRAQQACCCCYVVDLPKIKTVKQAEQKLHEMIMKTVNVSNGDPKLGDRNRIPVPLCKSRKSGCSDSCDRAMDYVCPEDTDTPMYCTQCYWCGVSGQCDPDETKKQLLCPDCHSRAIMCMYRHSKQQLADVFAKRKAEGTETEGLLAPTQFICPGCQWIGPMKDMDLHCPTCNMGMGAIELVSISKQHAKSLAIIVRVLRCQINVGHPREDLRVASFSAEDCDELLEDLEQ